MNKKFLHKILSTYLLLTLALTVNFIGYGAAAYANEKNTYGEKVVVKTINGLTTDDSSVYTQIVPENWDPTNATDEELIKYHFPSRPQDKEKLKRWEMLAKCKWVKPELVETNTKRSPINFKKTTTTSSAATINTISGTTNNWAGFALNQASTCVDGFWSVPTVSADSSHLPAYASQWVGLGGLNTQTLLQCGSADNITSSSSSYYTWYELLGTNYYTPNEIKVSSVPCKPGDIMYCRVTTSILSSTNMTTTFDIFNVTQNKYTSFNVNVTSYNNVPNSAEWIAERPKINGTLGNYPVTTDYQTNQRTVRFDICEYQTSSSSNFIGFDDSTSNLYNLSLVNGSDILATTKTPGSLYVEPYDSGLINDNSFNVDWKAYN